MAVRYILFRLYGDGSQSIIDSDLPVQDGRSERVLNGTTMISGRVPVLPEHLRQNTGTWTQMISWNSIIVRECDGQLTAGIIKEAHIESGHIEFEAVGPRGYLDQEPATNDYRLYNVDPLDVARAIWAEIQAQRGGNIGVMVDQQKCTARIGIRGHPKIQAHGDIKDVNGNIALPAAPEIPELKDEPVIMAWHSTADLGALMDNIAAAAPFNYAETFSWNSDKTAIRMRFAMRYPQIGSDLRALRRFRVGENVTRSPGLSFGGDDYATEVMMLGAGEGKKKLRAWAGRSIAPGVKPPVRKCRLETRSTVLNRDMLAKMAREELNRYWDMGGQLTHLNVYFTNYCPRGSFNLGDMIRVHGAADGDNEDASFAGRIVRMLEVDDLPGQVELTLVPEGSVK